MEEEKKVLPTPPKELNRKMPPPPPKKSEETSEIEGNVVQENSVVANEQAEGLQATSKGPEVAKAAEVEPTTETAQVEKPKKKKELFWNRKPLLWSGIVLGIALAAVVIFCVLAL